MGKNEQQKQSFREFMDSYNRKNKHGFLQFFSKDDDDDDDDDDDEPNDDDDDDDDDKGDDLDLGNLTEEQLDKLFKKNPTLRKWYNNRFKLNFKKRTKKLRDDDGKLIDADDYWKLKAEKDGDQEKKKKKEEAADEELKNENTKLRKQVERAERAEKRVAVKEYAIDNGLDAKLVARLVESELDRIEIDDDGDFDGIDEIVDELAEEFPQVKSKNNDDDDDDDEGDEKESKKSGKRYTIDGKQKINKKKKANAYNAGAELAKKRHKKD